MHQTLADFEKVMEKNCTSYTKWLRITHYQTFKSFLPQQTHKTCSAWLADSRQVW